MPKNFYCILKLGYVEKIKFPPHLGDCASKRNEILGKFFFWTLLLYVERQWNDCLSGIKFSKLVFIFQARILVEYFTDYLGYFIVWTFF